MKLPPQDWAATPGGRAILDALDAAGGTTRLVGGAVRDALLGQPVTDVDLATALSPDEATRRLAAAGIHVVPTGLAHGTVTAVTPDIKIEVTTLRRDVSTDGRHATVAYTDDWREDAARRDFTINALYAALPSGPISDYFGGLDDLARGRVRFIGEPLARIAEDHLRILRFFRFHGRFGQGPPDADALAACAARANDLMALSRERIRDELLGILVLPNAAATLRLMLDHGILRPVLPEIDAARIGALEALVAREAAWSLGAGPLRRLASLLPADAAVLADIAARLRLSRRQAEHLAALADRYHACPDDPSRDAYWYGRDVVVDRLLLFGDAAAPACRKLDGWRRPTMPISGKDVIARGIAPGPEVSRRVAMFERRWVDAGFPDEPATVGRLLDAVSSA